LSITAFWDVAPYNMVDNQQGASDKLMPVYQKMCHIQEDSSLHSYWYEDLRSYTEDWHISIPVSHLQFLCRFHWGIICFFMIHMLNTFPTNVVNSVESILMQLFHMAEYFTNIIS
jgi:hypothetical protein